MQQKYFFDNFPKTPKMASVVEIPFLGRKKKIQKICVNKTAFLLFACKDVFVKEMKIIFYFQSSVYSMNYKILIKK